MEPEQPPHEVREGQLEKLKTVTPLSKYLAMVLFIAMPFIGGWIGYTYAPEKVVEVEKVIAPNDTRIGFEEPSTANDFNYKKPGYGTFVYVDPSNYEFSREYFIKNAKANQYIPEDIYPYQARRLSDNQIILSFSSNPGSHTPFATVIYNEKTDEITRTITYPWFTIDYWPTKTTQVFIDEGNIDNPPRVVVRDYLNETKEVLYIESEANIQLADVCEMGCIGLLYVTSDGQVVFGRHEQIEGTTATKLIEILTMPIPPAFLSEAQKEYQNGSS